jgi:hypothetical protein
MLRTAATPFTATLYAVFLASSWTWVIGMFLPAILIADYGPWAFVAFALPNVLGAASVGLLSQATSNRLLTEHQSAFRWFSLITIAQQIFFIGWLATNAAPDLQSIPQSWLLYVVFALLIATIPLRLATLPQTTKINTRSPWLYVTAAVFLTSIVTFFWLSSHPQGESLAAVEGSWTLTKDQHELIALLICCSLGFLTCPFLDLTFHRARAALGTAAKRTFILAFFIPFMLMILMTLGYAHEINDLAEGITLKGAITIIVTLHILPQALITLALHNAELTTASTTSRNSIFANRYRLPAVLAIIGIVLLAAWLVPGRSMSFGHSAYRLFLTFYGLVFPAYILICLVPIRLRDGKLSTNPTPTKCWWALVAIALAGLPMYQAILNKDMWFAAIGAGVVLCARIGAAASTRRTWGLS